MDTNTRALSRLNEINRSKAGGATPRISPIDATRITKAKAAFATRRVSFSETATLISGDLSPAPGDLVLACVDRLGQHTRIELVTGRRAPLFLGDEIILSYGHRYAPDQFEGEIPDGLEPCNMVAAGGIAAHAISKHSKKKPATRITPRGLLGCSQGRPMNLADWALAPAVPNVPLPPVFAVVGSTMNAGKTMSAAYLIKGLVNAGLKVGAAKVTGTGAGCDVWLMSDAGAELVLDFTDAGFASTYRVSLRDLEYITTTLLAHLQRAGVDAIVLEVADGLFQEETAALLGSPVFRQYVDGMLFAASDAMGAATGVNWLTDHGLPVIGVSGLLTASPLSMREAQGATGMPVMGLDQLSDAKIADIITQRVERDLRCLRAG